MVTKQIPAGTVAALAVKPGDDELNSTEDAAPLGVAANTEIVNAPANTSDPAEAARNTLRHRACIKDYLPSRVARRPPIRWVVVARTPRNVRDSHGKLTTGAVGRWQLLESKTF